MELEELPRSNLTLTLGIISVATCWLFFSGIILGISALLLTREALEFHKENPHAYQGIQKIKTARILGVIGIVLNVIVIIGLIYLLYLVGINFAGAGPAA